VVAPLAIGQMLLHALDVIVVAGRFSMIFEKRLIPFTSGQKSIHE
jgi:hypothetical protein